VLALLFQVEHPWARSFVSLGFLVSGIFENWSKERDARRMIHTDDVGLAESELWISGKPAEPGRGSE
jgi:hypothetical protein